MESIKRNKTNNIKRLDKEILEAKEVAEIVAREGRELYDNNEIDGEDLHKILLAIGNLFEYLNKKYGDDEKLSEEVSLMTKTLYDPVIEQKGIEKGIEKGIKKGIKKGIEKGKIEVAKNLIKMGLTIDQIIDGTGLKKEEIEKLRK